MSKRLMTLGLCGAMLLGCGSESDSSFNVDEYSLSAYEGRSVSTETLAGTWVAVGTGFDDINSNVAGSVEKHFAFKEYFVISPSEGVYQKRNCREDAAVDILVSDSVIEFDTFEGTIIDNKQMSVTSIVEESYQDEDESYTTKETINMIALKISDETTSFANISANDGSGEQSDNLFCFSQSNGYIESKRANVSFVKIETYSGSMAKYEGDEFSKWIDIFVGNLIYYFTTDESGHAISFDISSDSSLQDTITFNASDNSDSVIGKIKVDLPAQ